MFYYAILTVKSNPDHIIIYCGTNNLKTDDYPEVISEKTFELAKSIKSVTNEAVILSINKTAYASIILALPKL